MNKTEKLICIVLGGVLAWYLFVQQPKEAKARAEYAKANAAAVAAQQTETVEAVRPVEAPVAVQQAVEQAAAPVLPSVPEEIVVLENDELKLELSSWGGVVKKATLKKYAQGNGPVGDNAIHEFAQAIDNTHKAEDDTETSVGNPILLPQRRHGESEILPHEIEQGITDHRADDNLPLPVIETLLCLHAK